MYSLSYAIRYLLPLRHLPGTESTHGILGRRRGRGVSPRKSFSEVITQCGLSSVSLTHNPVFPSDWRSRDFSERKISSVSLKTARMFQSEQQHSKDWHNINGQLDSGEGLKLSWKLQGVPPLRRQRAQTATRDQRWNPKVKNCPHCWTQAPHSKDHHAGPAASAHSWV